MTTLAAMGFAVMRSIDFVGPLCLPVGVLILLTVGIAYPIAILSSPQKATQLDLASNPVFPYIHMLAGVGLAFIIAFFVYFASDPFGYLYR